MVYRTDLPLHRSHGIAPLPPSGDELTPAKGIPEAVATAVNLNSHRIAAVEAALRAAGILPPAE